MSKQPDQRYVVTPTLPIRTAGQHRRCVLSFAFAAVMFATGCGWFDALFGYKGGDDRVIWSVKGHRNIGQPFFDDSLAYFLGDRHQVTAVDKRSGRIRWAVTLPIALDFTLGFGGLTVPGHVIVGDQDLFSLDPRDGSIRWRFVPTEGASPGRGIPTASGDLLFTGSSSGYVYAVEWATGRLRWATHLVPRNRVVVYQPRVADGGVYVSFRDNDAAPNGEPQGGVAAVDAATGVIRWLTYLPHNADPTGPTGVFAPAIAGGVLVVGADDGPLYAFDRQTGELAWKAPALPTPGSTTPETIRDFWALTSSSGSIFATSTAKVLIALDPVDGRRRWMVPTPLGGGALYLWADDRSVYLCHPGGQLEAYDVATGERRWQIADGPSFRIGPAMDGSRLYAGGPDGLFALRRD